MRTSQFGVAEVQTSDTDPRFLYPHNNAIHHRAILKHNDQMKSVVEVQRETVLVGLRSKTSLELTSLARLVASAKAVLQTKSDSCRRLRFARTVTDESQQVR